MYTNAADVERMFHAEKEPQTIGNKGFLRKKVLAF